MAKERTEMNDTELEQEVLDQKDAEADVSSLRKIRLRRPFEWEGTTYEELHFNFYKPTGKDCLQINRELANKGINNFRAFNNDEYIVRFAALACEENIGTDMLLALPGNDYLRVRTAVCNFLLTWETL